MKIIIGGFAEETNSFAAPAGREKCRVLRGEELRTGAQFRGIIDVVEEKGWDYVLTMNHSVGGTGIMKDELAEDFLDDFFAALDANRPYDALFLYIHGGMQFEGHEDGCAYLVKRIREHIGDDKVLAFCSDMHANMSPDSLKYANVITGMQRYPHTDIYEIGVRAARQGVMLLEGKPLVQALVRVPMIVPAEGYTSEAGPFKEHVMDYGYELVEKGEIIDFTVYQMQPWLDVSCAGSGVLVSAADKAAAEKAAKELAHRLFDIRKEMTVELYDLDEVIDKAVANDSAMPLILVDSADSSNAGASADSSVVLERLLERGETIKTCLTVSDPDAVKHAEEVGVGCEGEFRLGGWYEPKFHHPITVRAYVKALYDGNYLMSNGIRTMCVGRTALLQIGNIDCIVYTRMRNTSDPSCYRAFGIEPTQYRLVMVKSATAYKQLYSSFSTLFYPVDTPGSASANLKAMPFEHLPRPFFPLDDPDTFDDTCHWAMNN